ncbi:MAG: hypothetical protein HY234_10175 [Acidobacteria bacterium]|nr:hypothetical protein [Acidobacteriota bacterium]
MFENEKQMFPCPVCGQPKEIRTTKKKKPYIVCDSCAIQMFVRGRAGIEAFQRLADRAHGEDVWKRIAGLEKRYRLTCPDCGHSFWIEKDLLKTSWVDGSLEGFRCPQQSCEAVVKWE